MICVMCSRMPRKGRGRNQSTTPTRGVRARTESKHTWLERLMASIMILRHALPDAVAGVEDEVSRPAQRVAREHGLNRNLQGWNAEGLNMIRVMRSRTPSL